LTGEKENVLIKDKPAGVAKLADALDSKSSLPQEVKNAYFPQEMALNTFIFIDISCLKEFS